MVSHFVGGIAWTLSGATDKSGVSPWCQHIDVQPRRHIYEQGQASLKFGAPVMQRWEARMDFDFKQVPQFEWVSQHTFLIPPSKWIQSSIPCAHFERWVPKRSRIPREELNVSSTRGFEVSISRWRSQGHCHQWWKKCHSNGTCGTDVEKWRIKKCVYLELTYKLSNSQLALTTLSAMPMKS